MHDLAAILSHVEKRRVNSDYTFRLEAKIYRIVRQDICAGLRGSDIRVEQRRDGSVTARFGSRYLRIERCDQRPKGAPAKPTKTKSSSQPASQATTLVVVEPHPPITELLAQHAILLAEIFEHLLLGLVNPSGYCDEQEPEWIEDFSHGDC
jgi:hypothetical protein